MHTQATQTHCATLMVNSKSRKKCRKNREANIPCSRDNIVGHVSTPRARVQGPLYRVRRNSGALNSGTVARSGFRAALARYTPKSPGLDRYCRDG
jgi:hypothetical protein